MRLGASHHKERRPGIPEAIALAFRWLAPQLRHMRLPLLLLASALLAPGPLVAQQPPADRYAQLRTLFDGWRSFEEAPRVNGMPDYTPATNARRLAELRTMQQRLASIDTTGWSVPQQVDWHIVRAEMNGMLYHLTVLQPFARDPAYYASVRTDESDTPAEEGPTIHGAVRLWQYGIWPRTALDTVRALSPDERARLTAALRTVPPLLEQARGNLADANAKDLWVGGVRAFEEQHDALTTLGTRVRALHAKDAALIAAITNASTATERFAAWLRAPDARQVHPL